MVRRLARLGGTRKERARTLAGVGQDLHWRATLTEGKRRSAPARRPPATGGFDRSLGTSIASLQAAICEKIPHSTDNARKKNRSNHVSCWAFKRSPTEQAKRINTRATSHQIHPHRRKKYQAGQFEEKVSPLEDVNGCQSYQSRSLPLRVFRRAGLIIRPKATYIVIASAMNATNSINFKMITLLR